MTASGILKLGSIDLSFLSKSVHKKINFVVIRNSFKGNDQERIRRKKINPITFFIFYFYFFLSYITLFNLLRIFF